MAIGDSIDQHLVASTDLQPAVGVEDCVTQIVGGNTNLPQWKSAAAAQSIQESSTAVVNAKLVKAFITNTNFLGTIAANTIRVSGIQNNA